VELWRISIYSDLSGAGGLAAAGRWHSRGRPIVYLADHPSTALLERLVHMDRDRLPTTFRLLRVVAREDLLVDAISVEQLPDDWHNRQRLTQSLGDQWLRRATNVSMKVPSVIVPGAHNYLLNPAHPDATKITVAEVIEAPFDSRLFRYSTTPNLGNASGAAASAARAFRLSSSIWRISGSTPSNFSSSRMKAMKATSSVAPYRSPE
jgi:RES domain-containing protein